MDNGLENNNYPDFSVEKKGYNKSEVDDYIKTLADNIDSNVSKIAELENDVESLRLKLSEYENIDKELRNALISINEKDHESIEKSKEEASAIISEAEKEKDQIIAKAEEDAESTRDTLIFMKEQHDILVTRLRIIIDNQDAMLRDLNKGDHSAAIKKTMAEAAAFKAQTEINIDSILEKLL